MCAVYTGRRTAVGVAMETTPGSTLAPTVFIPYVANDLVGKFTPIADKAGRGVRDAQGSNSALGKKWGEGGIELSLDATNAGYFFYMAMGTDNTSSGGGIASYKHAFTRNAANEPKTASIWMDRGVDKVYFPYAVCDSLEMSFADDIAKLKVNILSKYPIVGDAQSPSYPVQEFYTFKHASLVSSDGSTTTTLKVRNFTLNINNNAEVIYAPNDNSPDRLVVKDFEVKGNFSLLFEGATQKTVFEGLSKRAMTLQFIGTTTGRIDIVIPKYRIDNWKPDIPVSDLAEEGIDFVAEYDPTTTKTISIDLYNQKIGY